MKKAVAVILALCMFGSVAAFAASEDVPLPDGKEWLCEEHHCIKNGDDVCSVCYQVYSPAFLSNGATVSGANAGYYAVNSSYVATISSYSLSKNATTGAFNGSLPAAVTGSNFLDLQLNNSAWEYSSGAMQEAYPYYAFSFDFVGDGLSFVEDLSVLQFFWTSGGSTPPPASRQLKIIEDVNSDGTRRITLCGNSLGGPWGQSRFRLSLRGSAPVNTPFSISNISMTTYATESELPNPVPPGPMSPPTDSDQWLDEQYQGAVNPELNDKLNDANSKLEQIEEIESSVIDQLDEHYTQVSPDNFEFDSNLISSMAWIGSQFQSCLDSFDSYGLMGVVTLPMFVGLCLLIIGRGGQVMAATRLHVNRSRRSDDA